MNLDLGSGIRIKVQLGAESLFDVKLPTGLHAGATNASDKSAAALLRSLASGFGSKAAPGATEEFEAFVPMEERVQRTEELCRCTNMLLLAMLADRAADKENGLQASSHSSRRRSTSQSAAARSRSGSTVLAPIQSSSTALDSSSQPSPERSTFSIDVESRGARVADPAATTSSNVNDQPVGSPRKAPSAQGAEDDAEVKDPENSEHETPSKDDDATTATSSTNEGTREVGAKAKRTQMLWGKVRVAVKPVGSKAAAAAAAAVELGKPKEETRSTAQETASAETTAMVVADTTSANARSLEMRQSMEVVGGTFRNRKPSSAGGNHNKKLDVTTDLMTEGVSEHLASTDVVPPGCMISGQSTMRKSWDILLLVLVLYTMVEVPFTIGFDISSSDSTAVALIDLGLNVIFIIDLISNFFTSYEEAEAEVYDRNKIAQHYVCGPWFWVDLLSCVPTELVEMQTDNVDPALFKGLKMIKLIRMGKLLKNIRDLAFASAFRIIRLLCFIVLMLHWAACAWALVMGNAFMMYYMLLSYDCSECDGVDEEELAANLDAAAAGTGEAHACCVANRRSTGYIYASCMYYSVSYLMGLGAINPISVTEKYFASVLSVYGACLLACITGSVAVLIAGIDADDSR